MNARPIDGISSLRVTSPIANLSREFHLHRLRAASPDRHHRPLLPRQRDSERLPETFYVRRKAAQALAFERGAGREPVVLHGLGPPLLRSGVQLGRTAKLSNSSASAGPDSKHANTPLRMA